MVIFVNKILTFVVNELNEILLLKGNKNDPQFNKSFWYTVTGGYEKKDKKLENTVIREVKEETGLIVKECIYLNWIFKYKSLGKSCIEYVYMSFVKKDKVILNEESTSFIWCDLDEFIEKTKWYGNKTYLKKVLSYALQRKIFFKKEEIEEF